jgi:ferric-dicitrate binding protein FerR (iron transport regulator)
MEQEIIAYLAGEATEEDRKRLNEWLQEEGNRQLFRAYVRTYYRARTALAWNTIQLQDAERRVRGRLARHRLRVRLQRVAAVILLAAGAWWFAATRETSPAPVPVATTNEEARKVVPRLTLPGGRIIEIDSTFHAGTLPEDLPVTWSRADALEYHRTAPTTDAPIHHTLSIPVGCEFSVTLPDGTRVHLNAASTLVYPDRFPSATRDVTLVGQAHFEIEADSSHPFRVHVEGMTLTVVGTSFDLRAYPDEPEIVTTLLSGQTLQRFHARDDEEVALHPGESLHYNTRTRVLSREQADIEEATAWRSGRIIARHRTLEEIFRTLAKWYNFEVVYADPALKDVRFYLNIKRYADIRDVLHNLRSTNGITLTYADNTIYVSK